MTAVGHPGGVLHQKLVFPRDRGRLPVFASHYRLGEPGTPGPALVYVGGAITTDTYRERMTQEPEPIRHELARALTEIPLPRLDVFVCPCPIDTRLPGEDTPAGPAWLEHHWDQELAPVLAAEPTALGLVGVSAGAALAVHLGVVLEARAVAILAAVGVAEALRAPAMAALVTALVDDGWDGLDLAAFTNQDDLAPPPARLAAAAPRALRVQAMPQRPGGHPFADYAANGSVAAAFRFVLARLRS